MHRPALIRLWSVKEPLPTTIPTYRLSRQWFSTASIMATSSTSGRSRRKSESRHKGVRRFKRFAAKAKFDYVPKEFQVQHPHLWALNVALNRVYKGKKVPEHISGPSLVRHFLRFRPFDGDKGKPMSDFTITLQRLYQLSLNHDNWLAATPKTFRQCLPFLISPSILLAARCAYGGSRMKRWASAWKLVKWMLQDQSTWSDRLPPFWKDSHFESAPWIDQHLVSEKSLEYPVPEGIMAQDIDAWLGHPGRPKDWDAFEITQPDYPYDWAAYIRETPSWIQAELALALIAASESTAVEAEGPSVQVPCQDNKDDTNPDLKEDEEDDSGPTNLNSPARCSEEAIKHAKWKKLTHKLVVPELLSAVDIAGFYTTLKSLVEISAQSKAKAQTRSEELVKKEEAINRLLSKLQAEKEELQQAIDRSRQKHEDCEMVIGKIKEEIVKRDCAKWPGKRQRLDDIADGVQEDGSHRKRQCREDSSDDVQDGGSHRKRQRLSLDDNGADNEQKAGSSR
ncbi:hypothetical protein V8F33_003700 [Rhypophila sp. PSN 637]